MLFKNQSNTYEIILGYLKAKIRTFKISCY